jgi:hypothetical protein
MTAVCDWIEGKDGCDYKCIPELNMDGLKEDISTYDEYAARWTESKVKNAIRRLFEEKQQPMIQAGDLLDIFNNIPQRAIAAIISEIVENKTFRVNVKGRSGYIVYRNGYYLFQPLDLIDIRVPLPLRVSSLPVKRDYYDFSKIMEERQAVIAPVAISADSGEKKIAYWEALKAWMGAIENRTFSEKAMPIVKGAPAKNKDTLDNIGIPQLVRDETKKRYTISDELRRELYRYGMILWMYEYMTAPQAPSWLTEYKAEDVSEEKKELFCKALAQAVLEFFWDTNLNPNEQQYLVRFGDEKDRFIGREQKVVKGMTEAFRYIDPISGKLLYICATGRCSEAVVRVLEQDMTDPINMAKVNTKITGSPYGFMVPEAKRAVIVFKTNTVVPAEGGEPDEGSKCSNISTIPVHTRMLKDIRKIMEQNHGSKLFFYDRLLDEDEIRRKESKDIKLAKDNKQPLPNRTVPEHPDIIRNLITAIRPCTVKELILRWLNIIEHTKGGKRYFYRPISALKSGHKGRIAKE